MKYVNAIGILKVNQQIGGIDMRKTRTITIKATDKKADNKVEKLATDILVTTAEMCELLYNNHNLCANDMINNDFNNVKYHRGYITNQRDGFKLIFDDTKRWLVFKDWQEIDFTDALESIKKGELVKVKVKITPITWETRVFLDKNAEFTLAEVKSGIWYKVI